MRIDVAMVVAGLIVGFVVGLTGMGGGALMTPILVLIFGVQPLAAVSSDLVASFFMKPVGAAVHARRGTIQRAIVLWLVVGSVPSAFLGVVLLRALGHGTRIQTIVQFSLGVTLVVAAAGIVLRACVSQRQAGRGRRTTGDRGRVTIRPLMTVVVGVVGGLMVGMTSVGSGSLIIVLLMFLYPRLEASHLIGTDLVQAVPLVASAAIGHLLFGDFRLSLTTSLLIGSIPGVYIGASISSRASTTVLRKALAFVLLVSGLKLLGLPNLLIGTALVIALVAGPPGWQLVRSSRLLGLRRPAEVTIEVLGAVES